MVVGKKENIQRIMNGLQEMQMVMREIADQIRSDDFSLAERSYRELKQDYLAFAVTVVDIVNGAAYLFDKESPSDRQNWKVELELDQFRHVLEMDSGK